MGEQMLEVNGYGYNSSDFIVDSVDVWWLGQCGYKWPPTGTRDRVNYPMLQTFTIHLAILSSDSKFRGNALETNNPVDIYMFKLNNKDTSGKDRNKNINDFLVSLQLTCNKFHAFFYHFLMLTLNWQMFCGKLQISKWRNTSFLNIIKGVV